MPTQSLKDQSVHKYEIRDFSVCNVMVLAVGGLHGPDVPLNVASICSSVLPLVSGMKAMVKMTLTMHTEANNQKVPALVRRLWKRPRLHSHECLSFCIDRRRMCYADHSPSYLGRFW